MAKQVLNLGTAADDGTGTKGRAGGDIINDNFTELYDTYVPIAGNVTMTGDLKHAAASGTEQQTNGDFSEAADTSDTGSSTSGWSWTNAGAGLPDFQTDGSSLEAIRSSGVITSDAIAVAGNVYGVTYTIGVRAFGLITVGGVALDNVGVGTHTQLLSATGSSTLFAGLASGTTGATLDDVSVIDYGIPVKEIFGQSDNFEFYHDSVAMNHHDKSGSDNDAVWARWLNNTGTNKIEFGSDSIGNPEMRFGDAYDTKIGLAINSTTRYSFGNAYGEIRLGDVTTPVTAINQNAGTSFYVGDVGNPQDFVKYFADALFMGVYVGSGFTITPPGIAGSGTPVMLSFESTTTGLGLVAGKGIFFGNDSSSSITGSGPPAQPRMKIVADLNGTNIPIRLTGSIHFYDDNDAVILGRAKDVSLSFDATNTVLQNLVGSGLFDVQMGLKTGGERIKNTTRVTGATYQILVTDEVVYYNTDIQASAATMPAGAQGQTIKVINSGTSGNDLTVDGSASEKLLGLTTVFTLSDGNELEMTYDTTDGWY